MRRWIMHVDMDAFMHQLNNAIIPSIEAARLSLAAFLRVVWYLPRRTKLVN